MISSMVSHPFHSLPFSLLIYSFPSYILRYPLEGACKVFLSSSVVWMFPVHLGDYGQTERMRFPDVHDSPDNQLTDNLYSLTSSPTVCGKYICVADFDSVFILADTWATVLRIICLTTLDESFITTASADNLWHINLTVYFLHCISSVCFMVPRVPCHDNFCLFLLLSNSSPKLALRFFAVFFVLVCPIWLPDKNII